MDQFFNTLSTGAPQVGMDNCGDEEKSAGTVRGQELMNCQKPSESDVRSLYKCIYNMFCEQWLSGDLHGCG